MNVILFPVLTLLKGLSWLVTRVKYREPMINSKTKCPACGYRGNRLNFIRTQGAEKGAVEHTCLMCGAKFYSKTLLSADKWLSPESATQAEKVKEAMANQVL